MSMFITLGVLLALVFLVLVIRRGLEQSGPATMTAQERAELASLRALVDDLRETAWDHRELDSALSTIVLDKIRSFERRRRGELG